jgi:hypothetical protein
VRRGGGIDKGKKGNKKDKKECERSDCIDGHFDRSSVLLGQRKKNI